MKGHKRAKGSIKQNFFTKAINRAQTIFSDNEFTHKAQTVGAYSAAFLAAFLVALVSASTFTPVDNSEAADTVNVNYKGTGYYINMATSGNVNMDLEATPDGAVAVAKDTVNVKTNSKSYKIYVSMNSNAADTNKLYLGGSTSATSYFNPVNGSATSPTALGNNTWGWSLAKANVNSANSLLSSYGFNENYTMSDGTTSDGKTGQTLNTNQKFAAMPLIGSEALIAAGTVATTSGTDYDVYYGAKANTALTSGTYSNTVLYTAVGEASSSASGEASISPEIQTTLDADTPSTYGKGQQVTIATSMYTSAGLDLGTVSATIGGKECTNVTTSLSAGGTVNITCNAPESLTWGNYDVVATFTKFDRAYEIADAYDVYVPWETMESASAGTYTMQSFTKKTCDEAPTPKAYNTQSGTGSILNGDTINTNVPEVTLKDTRNTSHEYRVRKLADGNCWMADNLRLTLSTSTPLTSETSDINYDMDTGRGVDGTTTTPRVISNNLQGTVDPLGTYSTDNTTGVISWTPFADSQTEYFISWGSRYTDASGATATTGADVATTVKYFDMDGKTEKVADAAYKVNNNAYAEYARSYDNLGDGQSGSGGGVDKATLTDADGNEQYYGTYFNWYAATAGSGTYEMQSETDAKNSVCPKNWQLPKNSENKSWNHLIATIYGMNIISSTETTQIQDEINATKKAPFSILQAGLYVWSGGSLTNRSVGIHYWTSTTSGYINARHFYSSYINSHFSPQNAGDKVHGLTVRCAVR